MLTRLKYTLLLAGFAASAAFGAPWSTVARNAESVVEVDTGSLDRKGQTVRAWSRQVYAEDQDLPLGDPPFRAVRYLYTYECGKRSALLVRRTYVDEAGEPIKDQMLDGIEMAKDVIPGTLQERVYEYACKQAKEVVAKAPGKPVQVAKAEPAPAKDDEEDDGAAASEEADGAKEDQGQGDGQGADKTGGAKAGAKAHGGPVRKGPAKPPKRNRQTTRLKLAMPTNRPRRPPESSRPSLRNRKTTRTSPRRLATRATNRPPWRRRRASTTWMRSAPTATRATPRPRRTSPPSPPTRRIGPTAARKAHRIGPSSAPTSPSAATAVSSRRSTSGKGSGSISNPSSSTTSHRRCASSTTVTRCR